MKHRRSMLFIVMAALVMLCSACAKGGADDTNIGDEVATNDVDTIYGTESGSSDTEKGNDATSDNTDADADGDIILSEQGEQYYYYVAEHLLENENEAANIFDGSWCLGENGLYYDVSTLSEDGTRYENELYYISYENIKKLDDTDTMLLACTEKGDKLGALSEKLEYDELEGKTIGGISAYGDGFAVLLWVNNGESLQSVEMAYFDGNNELVEIRDVTEKMQKANELLAEEGGGINRIDVFKRDEGNIFCVRFDIRGDAKMCIFAEDVDEVRKLVLDYKVGGIVYDGKDNLGWIHKGGDDGQRFVSFNVVSGESRELTFGGMKESASIYGGNDEGWLWSQAGLYGFDMAGGSLEPIVKWKNTGVKNGLFEKLRVAEDGSVYGAKLTGNSIVLYCMQNSGVVYNDEKTVLKLAVSKHSSSDFETLVRDFNASNSMYNVELIEYDDSYAFMTSLTSKDGADMISTDIIDMEQFAEKGYTADLYEFLNSTDSVVKAEDIIESIRNVYTFDGKLAALPVTFYPIVLLGGDEFNSESWNIDEFIGLIERNDRAVTNFMENVVDYQFDLAWIYWDGMKNELIEWKNMEAHFDNADFVRFLNALKNYEPPMPTDDYSVSQSVYWKNGQIYLYKQYLWSPLWLQYARAVMENDNPVILGYPTENGSAFPIVSGNSMPISAKSSNKEGAWQFIQYVLKNSDVLTDSQVTMMDFPVYIPLLNELLDEASVKTYKRDENYEIVTDKDGNPVEKSITEYSSRGEGAVSVPIYALTDEDREVLWYIFDNIGMIGNASSPTDEMFDEEIEAFLDGIRTAEQTAKMLQDRMTLMLEE